MKQLNIQERKLNLIEQLIVLNDEEVFKQVEELVHSSFQKPQFKRFTKQELENRAKIFGCQYLKWRSLFARRSRKTVSKLVKQFRDSIFRERDGILTSLAFFLKIRQLFYYRSTS